MFSQLATNLIIAYLCLSQGINSSLSYVSRSVLAASIYKVWSTVISRILQGHRIDKVSMIYLYFCKLNRYLIEIVYIISFYNHFAFVCFISYIFIDNRIDFKEKIFFLYFPISCYLYLRNHLILPIFWLYRHILVTGPLFDTDTNMSNQPPGLIIVLSKKLKAYSLNSI